MYNFHSITPNRTSVRFYDITLQLNTQVISQNIKQAT